MKHLSLNPRFLNHIPRDIEDGVLYISIEFNTAVHNCACGCGNKTVTRLSPKDWRMTYNGETVTLYPSIGNWGFPCQSHYWVRENRIEWAEQWTQEQILENRNQDKVNDEAIDSAERTKQTRSILKRVKYFGLAIQNYFSKI